MGNKNTLTSAKDFLKLIKEEKKLLVKFIKKDGSERTMYCTLDFKLIPKEKLPKGLSLEMILGKIQKGYLTVFDIEKMDWRTIPFKKIEWIKNPKNVMYRILKEGFDYDFSENN